MHMHSIRIYNIYIYILLLLLLLLLEYANFARHLRNNYTLIQKILSPAVDMGACEPIDSPSAAP